MYSKMIWDIQVKNGSHQCCPYMLHTNPRNKSNRSILFSNLVIKWSVFTNIISFSLGWAAGKTYSSLA